MSHDLSQMPCSALKGVGERLQAHLAKCDLYTVLDLLFHLPLRYEDRTRIYPIAKLRPGDHVTVEGILQTVQISRGKRRSLICYLQDGSGLLGLRFFHFTAAQKNNLVPGMRLRCFGEVRRGAISLEMIHPEYRNLMAKQSMPLQACLTPIYPTTQGLSQTLLRQLTEQALAMLQTNHAIPDYIPAEILIELHLPDLISALRYVHRPPVDAPVAQLEAGVHPTQQRLVFEELLAHQISLRRLREKMRQHTAPKLEITSDVKQIFLNNLPFALTDAQHKVIQEIASDLAQSHPMLRLVQGDVGSGKTVVAACAALQAIAQGYQVALMAPTELLAEQHYRNFHAWLTPLQINVVHLQGSVKGKERRRRLEPLLTGSAHLAIGTHALFQQEVLFNKLALIIIDEQHRFGVHQRLALREKGSQTGLYPHQLIMTATPIPRTLAMTAYADLDYSVIDELPPGRTPINTIVVSNQRRDEVIEHVRSACREQRQAYWVCTLISESEVLECQAAEATMQQLCQTLPDLRIGLVHGRMKSKEKEQIMGDFKAGHIDLLVATTVIEVGVDVPNASLMVIENPERLGLAQLHQLRGRVGRGATASHCVLMYQPPLSHLARQRLAVLRDSHDGFVIAKKDLELRGPGEVLGVRQTGMVHLRIADIVRDQALLPKVQAVANRLLHHSHIECLIKRWLGRGEVYAQV